MEYKIGPDELGDGQMKQVEAGTRKLLLVRVAGEYHAYASRCPHYQAPLAKGLLHDGRILCPWHQSVFDAVSGDLLDPPALAALPEFKVRVADGDVYVDVPDDAKGQRPMTMAAPDPGADARTFAIIGAGAVAGTAAAALREAGYRGRIVLVSQEDRWPYDRPNLSKDYLSGEAEAKWLPLRAPAFYERHGIERIHARVTSLDVRTRRIELESGQAMTPDAVLIASGGEPRRLTIPGGDLPGVFTLRSWSDCDEVLAAMERVRSVVVVGASFVGMEVAASLVHRGKDVTVVAPEATPFERTLGATVGGTLQAVHEAKGVRFRLARTPVALHGDRHIETVELDDGTSLPADLVVAGVGVRPATSFVHGVELDPDGGLSVDSRCRVAPGVWAAGDVARYPEPHIGEAVRLEHWRVAQQHGRAAAFAMAGADGAQIGVPFFWTVQLGLRLGFVGVGVGWTDTLVVGDPGAHDFTVYYSANDTLRAACGTRDSDLAVFAELLRTGTLPSASALANAGPATLESRL
jgi:NADPH-dependent 2,4-dienoyl-CoA reductase/sulfur reductase-like enzyme/nitrite reductase/ring-hydroxylating ferredoxin subunit